MRKTLIGIGLAMFAAVAAAAVLNFSWINATQNTDGSTIPSSGPGSLTNTVIEYGPCNTGKDALQSVTGTITSPNGTATSAASPNLPPGSWCARARHTNTYGEVSDWTAVVTKDVAAPKPKPPSNFSFGS